MLKRRVLLVEDHPMYRKGVKRLLEDTGRFQVVGEAVNGHDAIHQADIHRPEIVLIDIQLPGVTGLKIARVLRKQHHNMKIVFLSMHLDDERLFDAIRSGAMAFLTKDIDQETLVDSLRRVAQGENLINQLILSRPQLAWKVLSEFRQLTGDNEEGREREVAFAALAALCPRDRSARLRCARAFEQGDRRRALRHRANGQEPHDLRAPQARCQ